MTPPESVEKKRKVLEEEFGDLLAAFPDGISDEQAFKRIVAYIETKIADSYNAGDEAGYNRGFDDGAAIEGDR